MIGKTLIEHIISASATSNQEAVAQRQQRGDHYLDDLFVMMSAVLSQLAKLRLQESASDQPQRLHPASNSARLHKLKSNAVAESTLAACLEHLKTLPGQQPAVDWQCELNDDFDALNPPLDSNFCSCTHAYECTETEQCSTRSTWTTMSTTTTSPPSARLRWPTTPG